jgi:hypothetical protein
VQIGPKKLNRSENNSGGKETAEAILTILSPKVEDLGTYYLGFRFGYTKIDKKYEVTCLAKLKIAYSPTFTGDLIPN